MVVDTGTKKNQIRFLINIHLIHFLLVVRLGSYSFQALTGLFQSKFQGGRAEGDFSYNWVEIQSFGCVEDPTKWEKLNSNHVDKTIKNF